MEKMINYDNFRSFAYSNDKTCGGQINGIVLEFSGLGAQTVYDEDSDKAKAFAQRNIIYIVPYYNPWCWMNRQAVSYVDELVDVLISHFKLPKDIAIVSTGGSMGGLSALVYTRYAVLTPIACVTNCPVCDLPYHYTERPDLPRTLYSAVYSEEGLMEDALKQNSPLHLTDSMPDVLYYNFHCGADQAVNKELHSDQFVEKMKQAHKIVYHVVPGRGHCDLTEDMWEKYYGHIYKAIEDKR